GAARYQGGERTGSCITLTVQRQAYATLSGQVGLTNVDAIHQFSLGISAEAAARLMRHDAQTGFVRADISWQVGGEWDGFSQCRGNRYNDAVWLRTDLIEIAGGDNGVGHPAFAVQVLGCGL